MWCCTLTPSLLPPQTLSFSGARTLTSAFGSAPWARRSSIAATWPFFAAKWKAVQPRCEGARKGARHGRCGEHETRAPQHRRARLGVTSVGSGRGTQQQGLCHHCFAPCSSSRAESRWCGHVAVTQRHGAQMRETLHAAPRRRPLAIAQLASLSSRVTFQVSCDYVRRGERKACAGGSCVSVHLS